MRKVLPPTLNWRAVPSNELTVYFCSYLHNPQHHVRILRLLFMYVPCNSRRSSFMVSIGRIFCSILNDTELPKSSCVRSQCSNSGTSFLALTSFHYKHVQKQCFIQIASQSKHRKHCLIELAHLALKITARYRISKRPLHAKLIKKTLLISGKVGCWSAAFLSTFRWLICKIVLIGFPSTHNGFRDAEVISSFRDGIIFSQKQ